MLIDWFTVVAQLINFAILVWLLKRLLYRRILDAMDKRQAAILDEARRADEHRKRAESEADAYSAKLVAFDSEHAGRMRESDEEIRTFRSRELSKARDEIRHQRTEWSEALTRQKEEFAAELRSVVGDQICEAASKMVTDLANASLEQQMLERFASQLATDKRKRTTLLETIGDETAPLVFVTTFPVSDSSEHAVRRILAPVLPDGVPIHFEQSDGDQRLGVVLKTRSHQFEWNVDAYTRQLVKNVEKALATEGAAKTRKKAQLASS